MGERAGRVGRYVRVVAQPGQGGALADTLLRVAEGLRDAPGCELYVVNVSADEDDTVWVTEVWADDISDVLGLLAGPPELVDLTPWGVLACGPEHPCTRRG